MTELQFSFLNKSQFPLVHRTFLEAFSDYQMDMSYMTEEVMFKRAVKNALDFESSVGVFDDDRMVAFTLIGVDNWQNTLFAFDIGTGIQLLHLLEKTFLIHKPGTDKIQHLVITACCNNCIRYPPHLNKLLVITDNLPCLINNHNTICCRFKRGT